MLARFVAMPDEEANTRSRRVDVKHYSGKREYNLTLLIQEIQMTKRSGLISHEQRRVSLAISKLDGRSRELTLKFGTSVDLA